MRLPVAALALLAAGCAAPSFVGQTGRVTPKGSFRVSFGSGYQVNTSAADVVRDGRDLARRLDENRQACPDPVAGAECWDLEDVKPVVDAGYRFALIAPLSSNTQVGARWGFAPGFDVGGRFGPGNKGLDVAAQVFGPREAVSEGWAGSVIAGWGTRDMGTLGDVIESVLQGEAGLTDWQLGFVAGRQFREWGHFYTGGRYILTRWKLQVLPEIPIIFPGDEVQRSLLGTDAKGSVHHLGAVVGGALGYKHVFLGAELNLIQSFGHAEILFEQKSFSGFGVMPAVYVYGQY